MRYFLSLVLAAPILVSGYYSIDRSPVWVFLALAGLALVLLLVRNLVRSFSPTPARQVLNLLLIEGVALFQLSRLLSFYFQGESFNDRFFFHFNLNSLGEAGTAYTGLLLMSGLYLGLAGWLAWQSERRPQSGKGGTNAMACIVALMLLVVTEPDVRRLTRDGIESLVREDRTLSLDTIDWSATGLDQRALSARLNDVLSGKNLVMVYLESLEQIYTDQSLFPGLTPNIEAFKNQGLTFTEMRQTEGTGWTVGGLLSSQCGTPLLYSFGPGGNDILQSGFLSDAVCMGDILQQAGYHQVFMGGATTAFAGKGSFLEAHGYDEVLGREQLAGRIDDPAYLSGWGLYDDSLFALAAEQYNRLAATGSPFNLTVLTLDTHHPAGAASASCPSYPEQDNSILDAVHCSDFLLGQFIAGLHESPAWEDTVVVLFSDHLAMRNAAQQYYPDGYRRELLFTVLNAGRSGESDRPGTHMDVAPTLLFLLGVRHNQSFLAGHSLLDEQEASSLTMADDLSRLNAIRYLNTSLLSRMTTGLCSDQALVSIENERLRIAGREVVLSISGNPVPLSALARTHALMSLINSDGEVRANMTFNIENLPHVLYQFQREAHLLLAPYRITDALTGSSETAGPIGLVLGSSNGVSHHLGSLNTEPGVKVGNSECDAMLEEIQQSLTAGQLSSPAAICRADDTVHSYFEPATGNLVLPRVAYESGWYDAELERNSDGIYSVLERNYRGSIQDQNWIGRCHAYFGNSELIVPLIRDGDITRSLHMRLIPGRDWEFEVLPDR